jgi:hypothetical protein
MDVVALKLKENFLDLKKGAKCYIIEVTTTGYSFWGNCSGLVIIVQIFLNHS